MITETARNGARIFGYVFAVFFMWFFTHSANAALIYTDPGIADVHRGDTVTVSVRLDTDEGECVNATDVVIEYGSSIQVEDIGRGESILSLWVEEPTVDKTNHRITFAGGIPGGYCGRIPGDPRLTNILAEIVFRLPGFSVGGTGGTTTSVTVHGSSQVFLHDGIGTKGVLRTQGTTLNLLDTPGPERQDDWSDRVGEDDIPPSEFSIELVKDSKAFSGRYFIVFNTVDKQSGLDHYEIMEEPFEDFNLFKWGAQDAPWAPGTSPHVLKDQSLNSTIFVKAIDKAGNETIAQLVPEPALRTVSNNRMTIVILVLVVGVAVAGLIGYALIRRRKTLLEEYDETDDTEL